MTDNRITAVVFDMDGVLFDTEKLTMDVWKKIAQRHGLEGIEEMYLLTIGRTTEQTKQLLAETYPGINENELYEESRELMRRTIAEQGLPIKDYSRDILDALKNKGMPLALASSTKYSTVCKQLGMAGYRDYFDVVIGGDMLDRSKPAPDIYLKACEELSVSPENAAAIEDSFNGVRSASSAGLYTIMVPDLVEPDKEILGLIHKKCSDLNEAKDHLLAIL